MSAAPKPPDPLFPVFVRQRRSTRYTAPYKVGFIDACGVTVIEANFDRALRFSEGLAAVSLQGKWGYIDVSGAFAIPPSLHRGSQFEQGRVEVCVGKKWGYFDRQGNLAAGENGGKTGTA